MKKTKLNTIVTLALLVVTTFPFADHRTLNNGRIAEYTGSRDVGVVASGMWHLDKIHAYQAWATLPADKTVLVAVLDTGIDATHPDLAGKVVGAVNFSHSDTADDVNGHGTYLAGIIAAAANGAGATGLAYNASLLNVKVAGDDGIADQAALAEGIIWATDNGAQVINISITFNKPAAAVQGAIEYAWSKGVLIVAAAGNNYSTDPKYPAAYPGVIGVAATDQNDNIAKWSNTGDWVAVDAPGVGILSTLPHDGYGQKNGTSAATALVSGEAALLFTVATDSNGDGRVNDEIRQVIVAGTDAVADNGAGRINVLQAAKMTD